MDKCIRIAIIDNGVNEIFIKEGLEKSITIDENGICIADVQNWDRQHFLHGTKCAMILEKYCPDCRLISIRILDENGTGAIKSIYPALEWCFKNHVRLINLSLGTSDFRNCEELRTLINEYVVKGLIIIAATANSGFVSFPASFTNVIGVAATGSPLSYVNDYMQLGIDTVVPSEHIVKIYNQKLKTELSNSYAAPYVSALIANRLKENNLLDIKKLKKFVKDQSHIQMIEGIYEPDWVYRACIVGKGKTSKAKYYFEAINGELNEVWEKVDTIIFFSEDDLKNIDLKNKHLIYLGNKEIKHIDVQGFFWSRETRQQQILNNHYQGNGLEVPIVILEIEATLDNFYLLTELRKTFADDGYNAYVIGMEPECVLSALEYMPEVALDYEAWKNFIESQVFYKQSDLIIWCMPLEDRERFLTIYPDYDFEISIYNEGESIVTKLSFSGEIVVKSFSGMINKKDVEEIYHIIKTKLAEGEDG